MLEGGKASKLAFPQRPVPILTLWMMGVSCISSASYPLFLADPTCLTSISPSQQNRKKQKNTTSSSCFQLKNNKKGKWTSLTAQTLEVSSAAKERISYRKSSRPQRWRGSCSAETVRWCYLACHPRLWLRVERSIKISSEPGVFTDIESAISAARPGDTILIAAGGNHLACNIQINKPLCLIGGGELPDDTILTCSRGSDSALEFLSTCKVANLTVKAELGCCLLHRSGRLTIDGCLLQCEENPLDYLSCPIVSTASSSDIPTAVVKSHGDSVCVSHTRIEGGAKAVLTSGTLALQRVRVLYARASLFFWFDVDHL